tara:strand:- start:356 stop:832 length:477 start_codon:yes stop_codon:yes gene_type:complete
MAHFAELNNDNKVLRVLVFDNTDVDANGGDQSETAATFCETIVPFSTDGVKWVQTSYSNNFRKQFASVNWTYDPIKDIFIEPQPFPSWSLNAQDWWRAPITYPTIRDDGQDPVVYTYIIMWNETTYQADNTKGWEARRYDGTESDTLYEWNGTAWIPE